jgi:hypothetical protein
VKDVTSSSEAASGPFSQLSNLQFVDSLYWGILQRSPDAGGQTNWVNALNANAISRADLVYDFLSSAEYVNRVAPTITSFSDVGSQVLATPSTSQAQVIGVYQGVFGRLPDYSGFIAQSNAVAASGSIQTFITNAIGSSELGSSCRCFRDFYFCANAGWGW